MSENDDREHALSRYRMDQAEEQIETASEVIREVKQYLIDR